MSHKFDFTSRMEVDQFTLPAADLMLTKLQVGQLTEKDVRDIALLVASHELGDRDAASSMNLSVIAAACAADWGLFTTASDNLDATIRVLANLELTENQRQLLSERLRAIRLAIENEPKGTRWKMRARIGRRLPWYETPEEVRR